MNEMIVLVIAVSLLVGALAGFVGGICAVAWVMARDPNWFRAKFDELEGRYGTFR